MGVPDLSPLKWPLAFGLVSMILFPLLILGLGLIWLFGAPIVVGWWFFATVSLAWIVGSVVLALRM